AEANPSVERLALKLATGAGKTTVMSMLIAWQTLNAVRRSGSKHFTRGFLIVAPGLTIKDRLRVLHPNDPDNYYSTRDWSLTILSRTSRRRGSSSQTITPLNVASGWNSLQAGARCWRAGQVPSCRRSKPK